MKSCGPSTRSVGPTDRSAGLLVGRTHLSGDGREPGRWGTRGTHVSQAPERCVGAATLERS
jgi:hypothetical protein